MDILMRKNLKHVVTVYDHSGTTEKMETDVPLDTLSILKGVAELNRNGFVVWSIQAGVSVNDKNTKIMNIESFGIFHDDTWVQEPSGYEDLMDDPPVPFKTDSWVLGEYLVRLRTGKGIPRRFLKSQALLDKFTKDDDMLKKLLVLDKDARAYTWDIIPKEPHHDGCVIS
jgi:hypothetical protein